MGLSPIVGKRNSNYDPSEILSTKRIEIILITSISLKICQPGPILRVIYKVHLIM